MRSREQILSAWSVTTVLRSRVVTVKGVRYVIHSSATYMHASKRGGERISVVYRAYMEKLLRSPKSKRNQLIIEYSALNGLRSGEIPVVRVEDIDFHDHVLFVLDSKRHAYLPKPADPVLLLHIEEYMRILKIVTGYVLRKVKCGRPSNNETLEPQSINKVWSRECNKLGLPALTPRDGRKYCAFMHYAVLEPRLTVSEIQLFLGHKDLQSTEHYLRMVDFDMMKMRFLEQCRNRILADRIEVKN